MCAGCRSAGGTLIGAVGTPNIDYISTYQHTKCHSCDIMVKSSIPSELLNSPWISSLPTAANNELAIRK